MGRDGQMTLQPPEKDVWSGRRDGDGPEHARWHQQIRPIEVGTTGDVALVGFASDEGVRRNQGRTGAADGPDALRRALGGLPLHAPLDLGDLGTVTLVGGDLEAGQVRLGEVVAAALDSHKLVVVLGGGHETAYGSYLGWTQSARTVGRSIGVVNLDAHFDLRDEPCATSGTPFRQMAQGEQAAGRPFRYAVLGISEASNTSALFRTAAALEVEYLSDRQCQPRHLAAVSAFVAQFLDGVDVVHLSIDLDVLPGERAPGVSAPAVYGVPMETLIEVCRQIAFSGKLALVDVVELAPNRDVDGRTARAAARLVFEVVGALAEAAAPRLRA